MERVQRAGGIAALVQGVLFLLGLIFVFATLPAAGLGSIANLFDPTKVLPYVESSGALPTFGIVLGVGFAMTLVIMTLGLYYRMRDAMPRGATLAMDSAVVAAPLLLVAGFVGFTGLRALANLYGQNAGAASTAYVDLATITQVLLIAAIFAAGWSALFWGWAGARTGALNEWLGYLAVLGGLTGILTFAIPQLLFPFLVIGLIFSFWAGAELLRTPTTVAEELKHAVAAHT